MLAASETRERTRTPADQLSVIERKKAVESLIAHALHKAGQALNLSKNIAVAVVSAEEADAYVLHPEEARAISPHASAKRRLSWAMGRAAARRALKDAGITHAGPILRCCAGEPIWPDGISGSITHCYPWSVAAVTRSSGFLSLGIDLERMDRIHDIDISSVVCRDSERDWVFAGNDSHERLCMIFSAKEAVYKSLYGGYRRYIDFAEVELSWCAEQSCFRAVLPAVENHVPGRLSSIPSHRQHNLIFSCAVYETQ